MLLQLSWSWFEPCACASDSERRQPFRTECRTRRYHAVWFRFFTTYLNDEGNMMMVVPQQMDYTFWPANTQSTRHYRHIKLNGIYEDMLLPQCLNIQPTIGQILQKTFFFCLVLIIEDEPSEDSDTTDITCNRNTSL